MFFYFTHIENYMAEVVLTVVTNFVEQTRLKLALAVSIVYD
jgi:hypothetical protein